MPELRVCPRETIVYEEDRLWYTYKKLPANEYLCCEECYHYFVKNNNELSQNYKLLDYPISSPCDYSFRNFNQIKECPKDEYIPRKDRNWYTYSNVPTTEFTCCEQCFNIYIKGTEVEQFFHLHIGPLDNCNCDFIRCDIWINTLMSP
jgi:hypothetical protein